MRRRSRIAEHDVRIGVGRQALGIALGCHTADPVFNHVADGLQLPFPRIDRFVGTVRSREGRVAGYILDLEGNLFACSNDATWLREWQKATTN